MDQKKLAQNILIEVGGEENVRHVIHCATRLRFTLKDYSKPNRKEIEQLDGVLSVVESGGTFQVVIGNNVSDIYKEVLNQTSLGEQKDDNGEDNSEQSLLNRFIDVISSIFSPLLGVLAGAGLLKGLLALFTTTGLLTTDSGTYRILFAASDGFFYFLPIFLALTAAKRFNANQFLAMAIASALVYPDITAMLDNGESISFLGLPVILMKYATTVIPILLSIFALSYVEKFLKKLFHESIRGLLVPLLSLVIMVPLTLLVLGPVGTSVSTGIAAVVSWTYELSPTMTGVLIGGSFQLLVMFGLHWGLIPVMLNNLSLYGRDPIGPLYGPAVVAQAGAALGVFLKIKDKKMKGISLSACITGLFGITEPAIYGVNLKLKKPFIAALISGAIGGGIAGYFQASALTLAPKSILTFPVFIGPGFWGYVVGFFVAFILSVVLTYILGFEEPSAPSEKKQDKQSGSDKSQLSEDTIASPLKGKAIKLSEVKDDAFSSEAMGKGMAIIPEEGKLYSPVEGELTMAFPTGHAYGLTSNTGIEVLIHLGIDTVQLQGEHFNPVVKSGEKVKQGDLLATFDLNALKEKGFDMSTPVIITNTSSYLDVIKVAEEQVDKNQSILTIVK